MLQNYTKTDSWFQKLDNETRQLQISSGKSKSLKFDGLLFPLTETLYTGDLSNIILYYLCEKLPNSLCRAQTLHCFNKSIG